MYKRKLGQFQAQIDEVKKEEEEAGPADEMVGVLEAEKERL